VPPATVSVTVSPGLMGYKVPDGLSRAERAFGRCDLDHTAGGSRQQARDESRLDPEEPRNVEVFTVAGCAGDHS